MRGRVWLVLSGVTAVLVLDTLRGRQRRDQVLGWLQSTGQRFSRGRNTPQESTGTADAGQDGTGTMRSATDVVGEGLGNATTTSGVTADLPPADSQPAQQSQAAQSSVPAQPDATVADAQAATISAPAAEPGSADTMQPVTAEELAPRPILDPIPEQETNDPTLVARVESELFRDPTLPKGALSIDAVNGVVTLRGTVDAATATDLLERTGAIEGVEEVVDLLKRAE